MTAACSATATANLLRHCTYPISSMDYLESAPEPHVIIESATSPAWPSGTGTPEAIGPRVAIKKASIARKSPLSTNEKNLVIQLIGIPCSNPPVQSLIPQRPPIDLYQASRCHHTYLICHIYGVDVLYKRFGPTVYLLRSLMCYLTTIGIKLYYTFSYGHCGQVMEGWLLCLSACDTHQVPVYREQSIPICFISWFAQLAG